MVPVQLCSLFSLSSTQTFSVPQWPYCHSHKSGRLRDSISGPSELKASAHSSEPPRLLWFTVEKRILVSSFSPSTSLVEILFPPLGWPIVFLPTSARSYPESSCHGDDVITEGFRCHGRLCSFVPLLLASSWSWHKTPRPICIRNSLNFSYVIQHVCPHEFDRYATASWSLYKPVSPSIVSQFNSSTHTLCVLPVSPRSVTTLYCVAYL